MKKTTVSVYCDMCQGPVWHEYEWEINGLKLDICPNCAEKINEVARFLSIALGFNFNFVKSTITNLMEKP